MLAFAVAPHHFVVDVRRVVELVGAGAPLPLPQSHPALDGLLIWRGRALPLLNLRRYLALPPPAAPAPRSGRRTLVVQVAEQTFALAVDAVDEVVGVRPHDLLEDAQVPLRGLSAVVLGCCQVAGKRHLLLDLRPLAALLGGLPAAPADAASLALAEPAPRLLEAAP